MQAPAPPVGRAGTGGATGDARRIAAVAPRPTTPDHPTGRQARGGFIIGPLADGVFIVFAPLLALGLGLFVSVSAAAQDDVVLGQYVGPWSTFVVSVLTSAHLAIVFVRSHGNRAVFATHPYRFTVAPLALLVAMTVSTWVAVSVSVLATWWDVYHSALQTFGLGRIYDAKRGNDPNLGRSLDRWLNLVLYVGPILAGATLMDHVRDFQQFEAVGSVFFTAVPAHVESRQRYLAWAVLLGGIPVIGWYVWAYWGLYRRGYRVSPQKVALVASTALCSVWAWGFNAFGQAFFIMNFFHALQYFALVWWTEGRTLASLVGLRDVRWARPIVLTLFVGLAFAYGVWAMAFAATRFLLNVVLVVSIMHFWYDGFIWSVRRRQV